MLDDGANQVRDKAHYAQIAFSCERPVLEKTMHAVASQGLEKGRTLVAIGVEGGK